MELQKNTTELPMKFFVDYLDALRRENLTFPVEDPIYAQRYATLQEIREKKQPQSVDLVNSVGANGLKADEPEPQVLFFRLKAPAS